MVLEIDWRKTGYFDCSFPSVRDEVLKSHIQEWVLTVSEISNFTVLTSICLIVQIVFLGQKEDGIRGRLGCVLDKSIYLLIQ